MTQPSDPSRLSAASPPAVVVGAVRGNAYLSQAQLEALLRYKYQAGLYGYLDRIMTPFWNWAVLLLPRSLAPNLVTLIALSCMATASILIMILSPTLTDPLPTWALIYCALSVFLYQTLDAIDGKQARRTHSSSPLGQLFDHGCDSVCVTLLVIVISGTIQAGDDPRLIVALFLISTMPFYMANWEHYQTGLMRFGIVGVTEGQMMIIGIVLSTAVFGDYIWKSHFFVAEVRSIAMGIGSLGALYGCLENIYQIFFNRLAKLRPSFVKQNAILQAVQFSIFIVFTSIWMTSDYQDVLFQEPFVVLFTAGLSFSYLVNRLIISDVTQTPSFSAGPVVIVPLFVVTGLSATKHERAFIAAIRAYLIYVLAVYCHFVFNIVNEICSFLNIRPFFITKKIK